MASGQARGARVWPCSFASARPTFPAVSFDWQSVAVLLIEGAAIVFLLRRLGLARRRRPREGAAAARPDVPVASLVRRPRR